MEPVLVYANSACAHCCHATDVLADFALARGIPIAAVDVALHASDLVRWGAEASPLLVVGGIVYPGLPDQRTFDALVDAVYGGSVASA